MTYDHRKTAKNKAANFNQGSFLKNPHILFPTDFKKLPTAETILLAILIPNLSTNAFAGTIMHMIDLFQHLME